MAPLLMCVGASVNSQDMVENEEDVYILNPFVVESSGNVGYLATSTLAGTRLNTQLKDVGSAISVVTKEFMQDTGATNNETLLVYTMNTEVGGVGGNFTNVSNGASSYEGMTTFLTPHSSTRVRGLSAADNTRDYFVTEIPWDGFNVDRVDLQRGPNSILFGLGSPAGIINTDLKDADFGKNFGEVEARYGRFGSYRGALDVNRIIMDNELAVRAAVLYADTKYQQKPAYAEDERYYAAVKYEPSFLKKGSARTTLRMNAEVGDLTSNRPRTVTPADMITPWFGAMNKLTIDPYDNQDTESERPNSAWEFEQYASGNANPNYSPYIGNFGQLFGGVLAYFEQPDSSNMARYYGEPEHVNGHTPHGNRVGGVAPALLRSVADYSVIASNLNLPFSEAGGYKTKYLSDPSIFDFYHKLLDGPNKKEYQEWDSFNVNLSQGFFNEKVGLEFVYDDQNYSNIFLGLLNNERQNIYIDINHNMPDGSPNPNVGRPFVTDSGRYGNGQQYSQRESTRFSGFVDLDIGDITQKENLLTKIIGRHVFSGVYANQGRSVYREEFQRYATDGAFGDLIGMHGIDDNRRQINTVHYLGDSMMSATSASGAHLPRLSKVQKPEDGSIYIFDTHWNASGVDYEAPWVNPRTGVEMTEADNPANYVGWVNVPFNVLDTTDPDEHVPTITQANRIKDEVESTVFVWQGYLWDGAIVGTYGWREDTARNWSMTAPLYDDRTVNMTDFKIRGKEGSEQSEETTSYSIVAHINDLVGDRLPVNFSVFYNKGENFQPAAGRVDILGRGLPAPSGETEDYGFMISTKDNRYAARVNWYETTVANDANNSFNAWPAGIVENWAHAFATRFRDNVGNDPDFTPKDGMSAEATAALEAAALEAWFANPPEEIILAWGGNISTESLHTTNQTTNPPNGFTITADTMSKGMEVELMANPTDSLRISMNISRTEASYSNVGGTFGEYIEERLAYYRSTAAGEMRIWGAAGPTILEQWADQGGFLGNYQRLKLQDGAATPELREWRFNAVANYTFVDGALKGLNIGGGVRWQDEIAIGYPMYYDDNGDPTYDINNPYMGPDEWNFDMWAGYERPINDKIDWRIQLNVRNVGATNEVVPISVQVDGSPAAVRVAPNMTWEITNTFKF
ncbi:MAG: TonB-dependent receptor [Opitutales bacterium]|nr:TonB-dependent receptor [Opitutales bacterium]